MPFELTESAPAKVNLFLHVLGRRADGYHLLDSLVVFAEVGDVLRATDADKLSLTLEGPFANGLSAGPDNLVLRAARALAVEAGITARGRLTLQKNLPVASGIGGGSGDAAAALRLMCRAWAITPASDVLDRIAVGLGADVPVCLARRASRMRGIGEHLGPPPILPPCGIVLVNPGLPVATADVFRARQGDWSQPALLPEIWLDAAVMAADLANWRNDLEPAAVQLQPAIAEALATLAATRECLLARMSGSGATCFGLYANAETAAQAAGQLRRRGWWSWGGSLHMSGALPAVPRDLFTH